MPEAVIQDLIAKGHDVTKIKPYSIASCATAVLIDPKTGNRIAGADPRRDCYAMAY
jgi:gamma-glutamyltranspeptidase/glutathione hydrolase